MDKSRAYPTQRFAVRLITAHREGDDGGATKLLHECTGEGSALAGAGVTRPGLRRGSRAHLGSASLSVARAVPSSGVANHECGFRRHQDETVGGSTVLAISSRTFLASASDVNGFWM